MPGVRDFNYKPEWVFHGDSGLYMGIELETRSGRVPDSEEEIENNWWVLKSDASIDGQYEIVTHPFSYAERGMAAKVIDYFHDEYGVRCWRRQHAVHIHVNADFFLKYERQRLVTWMYENMDPVSILVARRSNGYYAEFRRKLNECDKYSAVADRGETLEFRVFRASTNTASVMGYVDFVHSVCRWVRRPDWKGSFWSYIEWAAMEGYVDLINLVYREASRHEDRIHRYKSDSETVFSSSDECLPG